ncbi:Cytochrome P450 86A7 [Phytophthora citrophthora]|uniref:Cytochrome P450 86A7 n=1 Tax=Phytophthora citrophthora TaxID=4793 RepID=A0AAD9LNG9_9STRA|nr:Cytochrome P450 86A7 [Phytophthora citrophthora]
MVPRLNGVERGALRALGELRFKKGHTIAVLKAFLEDEYDLQQEETQLCLDGNILLDPFSLTDFPCVLEASAIDIQVRRTSSDDAKSRKSQVVLTDSELQLVPICSETFKQSPVMQSPLLLLGSCAVAWLLASMSTALYRKLRIARGLAPIPGPPGVFLLGCMPAYAKNIHRIYYFLEDLLKENGGRMKMPWHIFFDGAIYITDPKDVQHVLSTNFNNYVKPRGFLDAFHELFGNSIVGTNHHPQAPDGGASWCLQRKVSAKVFTTANFRIFTEQSFARYAEEVLATAQKEANQSAGGTFCCDMQRISANFTLQSIFDVAFGLPLSEIMGGEDFNHQMDFINEHCAQRMFTKQHYKLFRWVMPSERELRQCVRSIHGLADTILLRRLEEPEEQVNARSDLLSLFICKARELARNDQEVAHGEHAASSLLGLETLRSIILTFIVAGRDTTSACITYSLYAVARDPRVQKRIVEELNSLKPETGSSVAPFTLEDVKNMKYLDAVVYEALRLYPSVPYNIKVAVDDDYFPDGTFVPAGAEIVYSPWCMGRNEAFWGVNSLEFRPERWLEMDKRPSAYEFPVFQAGPRMCLGMNMAVLEAKLFVATTLRRFHVSITPGEKHERGYVLKSGLFMEGGLPLQLTPRPKSPLSA